MSTVAVLATGGTIDHRIDPRQHPYTQPERVVEGLADEIKPLLPADVRLLVQRWDSRSGPALDPSAMVDIGAAVERLVSSREVAGVVVTAGTDMLEELAYALALVVSPSVRLVVTGSMRRHGEAGFDGSRNLLDSVNVLLSGRIDGFGPLVVFGGDLYSAAQVTKVASSGPAAFGCVAGGVLGRLVEGRLYLDARLSGGHYLGQPTGPLPTVDLIWVTSGMDASQIDGAVANRRTGIVVAGSGGGHVPPNVQEGILSAIDRGLTVLMTSRCIAGTTLQETYGGTGAETELIRIGVIPAGHISPLKARLRLIVGLSLDRGPREIFPVDALGTI